MYVHFGLWFTFPGTPPWSKIPNTGVVYRHQFLDLQVGSRSQMTGSPALGLTYSIPDHSKPCNQQEVSLLVAGLYVDLPGV